jgi:hypothetical protein
VVSSQSFDPKKPANVNSVCPGSTCVDSVAIGYLLAGVGGGAYLGFARFKNGSFGAILDVDALFAIPVGGQFGLNLDVQLGLGAEFL